MFQRPITAHAVQDTEGYYISISDLMAGLIFLFIITLMVFALNLAASHQDLKSKVKETELTLSELRDAKKVRSQLLMEIRDLLVAQHFTVQVNLEHGILRLQEEILFPFGSATLQPGGKVMLAWLAVIFEDVLPCYTGTLEAPRPVECSKRWYPGKVEAIFIEGHTDKVAVSEKCRFRDNWDLSAARATTYRFMTDSSPHLNELTNQQGQPIFSVSGYAEKRPLRLGDTEEERRLNRRIDFRFIMTPPKETPEVVMAIEEKQRQLGH